MQASSCPVPSGIATAGEEKNPTTDESGGVEKRKAAALASRALLQATLGTLEFLGQHVRDQPELWRVLSRLQEETAAYIEACDTRFKQFRALQVLTGNKLSLKPCCLRATAFLWEDTLARVVSLLSRERGNRMSSPEIAY